MKTYEFFSFLASRTLQLPLMSIGVIPGIIIPCVTPFLLMCFLLTSLNGTIGYVPLKRNVPQISLRTVIIQ